MEGNYSSDASPDQRVGRSQSQPRLRGEKSTSPSRKQDLLKIVPPKLISNDQLEERKSQRVARDLRESTKIFAHANEQRNSIRHGILLNRFFSSPLSQPCPSPPPTQAIARDRR